MTEVGAMLVISRKAGDGVMVGDTLVRILEVRESGTTLFVGGPDGTVARPHALRKDEQLDLGGGCSSIPD